MKKQYNAYVIKQMVNVIACTIELWCTREVAKHERSVRVARGVYHLLNSKQNYWEQEQIYLSNVTGM